MVGLVGPVAVQQTTRCVGGACLDEQLLTEQQLTRCAEYTAKVQLTDLAERGGDAADGGACEFDPLPPVLPPEEGERVLLLSHVSLLSARAQEAHGGATIIEKLHVPVPKQLVGRAAVLHVLALPSAAGSSLRIDLSAPPPSASSSASSAVKASSSGGVAVAPPVPAAAGVAAYYLPASPDPYALRLHYESVDAHERCPSYALGVSVAPLADARHAWACGDSLAPPPPTRLALDDSGRGSLRGAFTLRLGHPQGSRTEASNTTAAGISFRVRRKRMTLRARVEYALALGDLRMHLEDASRSGAALVAAASARLSERATVILEMRMDLDAGYYRLYWGRGRDASALPPGLLPPQPCYPTSLDVLATSRDARPFVRDVEIGGSVTLLVRLSGSPRRSLLRSHSEMSPLLLLAPAGAELPTADPAAAATGVAAVKAAAAALRVPGAVVPHRLELQRVPPGATLRVTFSARALLVASGMRGAPALGGVLTRDNKSYALRLSPRLVERASGAPYELRSPETFRLQGGHIRPARGSVEDPADRRRRRAARRSAQHETPGAGDEDGDEPGHGEGTSGNIARPRETPRSRPGCKEDVDCGCAGDHVHHHCTPRGRFIEAGERAKTCACSANFTGSACERCAEGYVGSPPRCTLPHTCEPACAHGGRCDRVRGSCVCTHPFAGVECTQCAVGHTGPHCIASSRFDDSGWRRTAGGAPVLRARGSLSYVAVSGTALPSLLVLLAMFAFLRWRARKRVLRHWMRFEMSDFSGRHRSR